MAITLRRMSKAILSAAAAVFILFGVLWLALPGILQSQAQQIVAEKSGHRLSLAKPEFNLLALSLRLRELTLEDPEGAPLLAFNELLVDLSAASITQRGLVFDDIRLDGLRASAILSDGAQGPLNWSRLLAAFAGKDEPKPAAPLPRIDIRHLALTGAQADIADRRSVPPFVSRIESVDLELNDISTLPDDSGRFRLTAKTAFGAQLEWSGEATLNPLGSSGHVDLRGIDLGKLAALLQPHLPPELGLAPPAGVASLDLDYRVGHAAGKLELKLDPITVKLAGLVLRKPQAPGAPLLAVEALELQRGRFELATRQLEFGALELRGTRLEAARYGKTRGNLLSLTAIALAPTQIDLERRSAKIGGVELKGGSIAARRDAKGAIDLLAALQALAPAASAAPGKVEAPAAPWRYAIERVALSGFGASLRDESTKPALDLGFADIALSVTGVTDNRQKPLPLKAALRVTGGGSLTVDGTLVPATAAAELQLKLDDLALKPAQSFLGRYAALDLAGGRLAAAGKLVHNAKTTAYRGSLALSDLRLNEAGTQTAFLAWKSLATRQLEVTAKQLHIAELTLDGLDTQLLIAADKSTNFKRILRRGDAPATDSAPPAPAGGAGAAAAAAAPAPAAAARPEQKAEAPGFLVDIDRLRFRNGELDFADQSLLLPFGTRIHRLRGSLAGLSSRPGAHAQLELDGEVDEYGLARATGQVDIFDPTDFMDIRVIFRNVEMTRLTPYSATFAGRRINSGKLSLDLEYVIKKRQLQSQNKVVMERLVLGERIASPSAKDLPLDLAIALLEDADGRIDLGLPVSGSLDDPQFSYGGLVWKVITNILTKIVTAPFRALGALFGGGDEKLESIAFDAGARRLTPPEREKLVKLAAALNKRPALALTLQGTWSDADRSALQDLQLRRTLLQKSGYQGDTQGDPGPVALRQPQIQAALEALFAERFGKAELAGLKQGFRSANPGQLEESLGGKVMSRLGGLMNPPRALSTDEVGALKGADFHALLYQRLSDKEVLPDDRLRQLAQARGEAALATLKEAGAPAARVLLGEPGKHEGNQREVPLRLSLGKAGA
ncbi:MAG: DUF748 domain-containing protein [Rhodocyclales bacterium]|nr:DUF748 domain-containing protein [Rhodocyclales bacterium]